MNNSTLETQDPPVSTQETVYNSTGTPSSETFVGDVHPANSQSQTENTGIPDSDAKSDASFDPLFDGDDADEMNTIEMEPVKPEPEVFESKIAMPGQQNHTQPIPAPGSVSQARPTTAAVAPPKNAPPLLDPASYATFSPDLLLTASIDGQVILWDRRLNTPGKGVGRLWLSEKTPPWCLSVCTFSFVIIS